MVTVECNYQPSFQYLLEQQRSPRSVRCILQFRFESRTHLAFRYLDGNQLAQVDNLLLQSLQILHTLGLSNNSISILSDSTFDNQVSLSQLFVVAFDFVLCFWLTTIMQVLTKQSSRILASGDLQIAIIALYSRSLIQQPVQRCCSCVFREFVLSPRAVFAEQCNY